MLETQNQGQFCYWFADSCHFLSPFSLGLPWLVRAERASYSLGLLRRTLILSQEGLSLVTLSNPKAPSSNTIPLGIKVSSCDEGSRGIQYAMASFADLGCTPTTSPLLLRILSGTQPVALATHQPSQPMETSVNDVIL